MAPLPPHTPSGHIPIEIRASPRVGSNPAAVNDWFSNNF